MQSSIVSVRAEHSVVFADSKTEYRAQSRYACPWCAIRITLRRYLGGAGTRGGEALTNEHKGTTRRIGAGRQLLSNPRQAHEALRAGFHSLPAMPIGQLFRRIPPVDSAPNAEPIVVQQKNEPSESRLAVSNGASFAGYTILRPLGAGGMAEVYLALHPRLPRRDVIKVLAEAVTADPEFRERFNREADLAATLWHPHIVGVHDRGEFNGHLWISMDYVEGTDASRLVKENYAEGMPIREVCAIVQAVAGALDYAHDRGLLHRDVKPANILLAHPDEGERRILLADFGVARHLGDISGITETIAQMSEITVSISTAIDQQGDATREIARNIQSAAAGSSEISAHIGGVTSAASATGKAATEVLTNARELDNQSGKLRNAVDEFLVKVRAA